MSREMASRSSRSRSYKTTSAPYALVRSRLERGASAGITMVARMFRISAAPATPWAWLPEENATTPPPRAACGIDDSLLNAPRNLNDPVRCSISGLRKTVAPTRSSSAGDDSSGVRIANGASTRAAASMSIDVTGSGAAEFDMHTFYREPRQGGKACGCRSGRKLRVFCRNLRTGTDFGSYTTDVVEECAGRRLPAL